MPCGPNPARMPLAPVPARRRGGSSLPSDRALTPIVVRFQIGSRPDLPLAPAKPSLGLRILVRRRDTDRGVHIPDQQRRGLGRIALEGGQRPLRTRRDTALRGVCAPDRTLTGTDQHPRAPAAPYHGAWQPSKSTVSDVTGQPIAISARTRTADWRMDRSSRRAALSPANRDRSRRPTVGARSVPRLLWTRSVAARRFRGDGRQLGTATGPCRTPGHERLGRDR